VEIHHHRQRRHRAGAVRHGADLFRRGAGAGERAENGFNWSALVEVADKCQPAAMRLGFVMVLVGYGTKAGLAPMHT